MNKYEARLVKELLYKSSTNDWDEAKKEWYLSHVSIGNATCACGKTPIQRICYLVNKVTLQSALLGSTCVEKYLYIKCNNIFTDLNRILAGKYVHEETLKYALVNSIICQWDIDFYHSVQRFSKLSEKQVAKLDNIHNRLGRMLVKIVRSSGELADLL